MSDEKAPWDMEEENQELECPHGYVEGEHHWYSCMGVDPIKEKESKIDFSLDISHRWYKE
jgi:hypothetical protein